MGRLEYSFENTGCIVAHVLQMIFVNITIFPLFLIGGQLQFEEVDATPPEKF